ncbi:hypothetical protein B0I35DRAFT_407365 [Stachybotrys elegans]|uniref:Uncharacterized protein n=1 Tax=Stachybotrys elegans TaxID=80388 RepID=A0A8K0SZH9_9HYPO|nr:hypothetical protein B0I35DRAFT_407365 [Stachybotrys elegans]
MESSDTGPGPMELNYDDDDEHMIDPLPIKVARRTASKAADKIAMRRAREISGIIKRLMDEKPVGFQAQLLTLEREYTELKAKSSKTPDLSGLFRMAKFSTDSVLTDRVRSLIPTGHTWPPAAKDEDQLQLFREAVTVLERLGPSMTSDCIKHFLRLLPDLYAIPSAKTPGSHMLYRKYREDPSYIRVLLLLILFPDSSRSIQYLMGNDYPGWVPNLFSIPPQQSTPMSGPASRANLENKALRDEIDTLRTQLSEKDKQMDELRAELESVVAGKKQADEEAVDRPVVESEAFQVRLDHDLCMELLRNDAFGHVQLQDLKERHVELDKKVTQILTSLHNLELPKASVKIEGE